MNERIPYLREKTAGLTTAPGVYIMKNAAEQIIYIGKAKNLKNRVTSYFRQHPDHTPKVAKMVSQVYEYDFIVTDSEYEALVLECSLIKQHKPKYNILLKDDKGYFYIKISAPPYARITAVMRNPQEDGVIYLGPYTSGFVTKQAVDEVNRVFQLPTCRNVFTGQRKRQRPCLNYHIRRCMGVCRGEISPADYAKLITEAIAYIKSGSAASVTRLTEEMERAAEVLDFERAAQLRDRISAITRASATQKIMDPDLEDADLIATAQGEDGCAIAMLMYRGGRLTDKQVFPFSAQLCDENLLDDFFGQYYRGRSDVPRLILTEYLPTEVTLLRQMLAEQSGHAVHIETRQKGDAWRKLQMAKSNAAEAVCLRTAGTAKEVLALEELGKALGLEKPPAYIEAYDISNLSSTAMVAGMIVFENGRPLKKAYKRFSIQEVAIQNDYACMEEVLRRRFGEYQAGKDEGFARMPDLILLDGGKGQIGAVLPVLRELGITVPLFGMVKDNRHRTRAIATSGGEISLSSRQAAFALVTRIQDEVHRFSVAYMHSKHKKQSYTMLLTGVKGIGEKKAQKLMLAYKTKAALQAASQEELAKTAGVPAETAAALYELIQTL